MEEADWILGLFFVLVALSLALAAAGLRLYRRGTLRPLMVPAVNLFLFLFIGFVFLTSAELYYRFFHDATDGYHLGLVSQRWRERHYQLNNFRTRDNIDYARAVTPGRRRVTFLGDSFTAGHGVAQVEDRFVNRLRRESADWEVHAFAQDGMDTGAITTALRVLLESGYELQDVVYVYCLNDITDIDPRWRAAARRIYSRKSNYLLRNSFVFDTFHSRFILSFDEDVRGYSAMIGDAYTGRIWSLQVRRLDSLIRLVEDAGGRFFAATFPFFESMESPTHRGIHERMDRFWRARNVPHVDLLDVYARLPAEDLFVNRYDTHPNEFAHGLAVEPLRRMILAAPKRPGVSGQAGFAD